jgi:hypothetical protein
MLMVILMAIQMAILMAILAMLGPKLVILRSLLPLLYLRLAQHCFWNSCFGLAQVESLPEKCII